MKRVLILDTETTGLDPQMNQVIEVAVILYSLEHATALEAFTCLIRADGNEAEAVNRIPAAALVTAREADAVWERVGALARFADAFVAHRAEFDRSFTPEAVRDALPWVCSKSDLAWPKQTRPEPSLVALALEHDLGVAYAHRALADCDLIARLFTRSRELGVDLVEMMQRGMRPKAEFVALVSYDDRELAKKAGFRWHPDNKTWRRQMFIDDAAALGFKVRQVEARP